jgi:site-specific recombinase XerD
LLRGIEDSKNLIDGFINSYVIGNGLDRRTEKAYRMDLEHFYVWADSKARADVRGGKTQQKKMVCQAETVRQKEIVCQDETTCEEWMEAYLDYLRIEKNLSFSTVYRKNQVLGYYLSYLVRQGVLNSCRPLKPVAGTEKKNKGTQSPQGLLSRKDADAFFLAMEREYEGLDSEFRKRVCLRDMVMMKLLFYHKIEISELLRIETPDYDRKAGVLLIRRKRGDDCDIRLYSQELLRKMELWLDERKAFQRNGEYCSRLFLSKYGKPLSMEMFIQIFDKYRKLAGIEKKLTPKDLKESSMKSYARELMMERCS